MRNSKINFNKINFVVCLLIFSNLWASIPKWVSDATNDRYWVGIGIFDSANSLSDEDPSMTAYLRAVEQIAAQMSVSIKASTKYQYCHSNLLHWRASLNQ